MSRADRAYYRCRADEEQASIDRATTLTAKSAHQQLHDLYSIRLGRAVSGAGFTVYAHDPA